MRGASEEGGCESTVLPHCYALLAVTPPPPVFGRNYCIGYFTSITRPPRRPLEPVCGTAVLARVRVLQV